MSTRVTKQILKSTVVPDAPIKSSVAKNIKGKKATQIVSLSKKRRTFLDVARLERKKSDNTEKNVRAIQILENQPKVRDLMKQVHIIYCEHSNLCNICVDSREERQNGKAGLRYVTGHCMLLNLPMNLLFDNIYLINKDAYFIVTFCSSNPTSSYDFVRVITWGYIYWYLSSCQVGPKNIN
jgi:hypothetical protein